MDSVLEEVPALMRRHGLTGYDAGYLALALRLGLAMGTLDEALRDAARAEGVSLLNQQRP